MDRLSFETPDLTARNIAQIAALFPNVVTEVKDEEKSTPEKTVLKKAINFDLLRQELSGAITGEGEECYDFTWAGKRASMVEANTPIKKTLRPALEESKNWETTENLYIEGDNLDVLKLLQESYLGKIKMIYIDPPYNTGNDFIYKDDYAMSREDYDEQIGLNDEEGNRLFQNSESNGRFHSDWCSMIYPRLKLAQNLLTDDGVIFISIDDNEADNLRKICDEIFGEDAFIAQFVWAAGKKNDSRYVSISHEYILCYVKNRNFLFETKVIWRSRKEGIDDIYRFYEHLKSKYIDNYEAMEAELKSWYKGLSQQDPAKRHSHYCHIDKRGIYFADNISWPGGGGPKYQVLHPVTKKPVKIPSRGWVFSKYERMKEAIDDDRVQFGIDENYVPCIKSYLKEREFETPYSVFYQDGRASTKRLRSLFGKDIFENPKDEQIIKKLIEYVNTENSIILDFFSGSATTAHAVMQLNAEDGGRRKFIMVQLAEPCAEGSEAYKAGYKTICDIGKERIRRAGEKIKADVEEQNAQLKLDEAPKKVPDIGFRVLKLDDTNMKEVYYSAQEYTQQMLEAFESNIKEDRTDLDLLYGCMLDWGLPLSLPHRMENVEGVRIHIVDETALVACFAEKVSEPVVRAIAKRRPRRAVFRDSSFANSPDKINVAEIFKLLAPETTVKVI